MNEVSHFMVGKPCPFKTDTETPQYNFRPSVGVHELIIAYRNPLSMEIEAAQKGKIDFAFTLHKSVIFLLFKLECSPWSDAPFSWWLQPERQKAIAEFEHGTCAGCLLVLSDIVSGLVKAVRVVGFSRPFTIALHKAINYQADTPWVGTTQHQRDIAEAYAKWPQPKSMIVDAIAKCYGGEKT